MARASIIRAAVMMSALTLLSGCLSYNHERRVEAAVLSDGKGKALDRNALTGALQAKFPVGSPVSAVEGFAKDLGGRCFPVQNETTVMCSIPLSGTLCIATDVAITIEVSDGAIAKLSAGPVSTYC